jgi:hypothetical protein
MKTILSIIGSLLICVIGLWKFFGRKNEEKRQQAAQAKKDIENANSDDGTASDFLDGFGRL